MKHLKIVLMLLVTVLAVACNMDSDSYKKGNPYSKEFYGIKGHVKYAVFNQYKKGYVAKATRLDFSPKGMLTKKKVFEAGDTVVTHYVYDSEDNIRQVSGTGLASYKNQYNQDQLDKEWFYTDETKTKGYTLRYQLDGNSLTQKENDLATGEGITTTFTYSDNAGVIQNKQVQNDGSYTVNNYDSDDHLTTIEHYDSKGNKRFEEEVTTEYDEMGNLTKYSARKDGRVKTYYKVVYKYYTDEELSKAKEAEAASETDTEEATAPAADTKKAAGATAESKVEEAKPLDDAIAANQVKQQADSTATAAKTAAPPHKKEAPGTWLLITIGVLTCFFLLVFIGIASEEKWFENFGGIVEIDGMRKIWMYNSRPYVKMCLALAIVVAAFLSSILLLLVFGGAVWVLFWLVKIILWGIIVIGWILLVGGLVGMFFYFPLIIVAIIGGVIAYFNANLKGWGEQFVSWGSQFLDNVNVIDWTISLFSNYGTTVLGILAFLVCCFLAWALLLVILSGVLRIFEFCALKIYNVNRPCPVCGCKEGFTYVTEEGDYPIPLHPGVYGIFHQTNHDTGLRVPTMLLNGKGELARRCPECGSIINKSKDNAYGTDIHIGIVGARSSGKSYMLYSGLELLMDEYGEDFKQIDKDNDNVKVELVAKRIHNNDGIQTADKNRYKAIQFSLNRKLRPVPYHLFWYDVAGEKFNASSNSSQDALKFYK